MSAVALTPPAAPKQAHRVFRPAPVAPASVRISVVIPAYNMGALLKDSMESVLKQSVPPHEIIVVDNGSTDDTEGLVRPYLDRVQYLALTPNQGASKARNAGAARATGDWFLFLDGDDRLFPDTVKHFREAAAAGGAGLIFGRVEQLDTVTGGRRERTYSGAAGEPPDPARVNFWRSLIASPGAAIVHREVHAIIGGYEKPWQPTEDRDYWMKCGVTTPFAYCPQFVLEKLYRPNSVRLFTNRGVYWGMRVQLEFLDWCAARGLSTDFLKTSPAAVVAYGLKRAFRHHDGPTLRLILEHARALGIDVPAGLRARAGWERALSRMLRTGDGKRGRS